MISVVGYRDNQMRMDLSIEDIPTYLNDKDATLWVDLEGPTVEETSILKDIFHFHPLTIEDCQAEIHFPKVDNYQDYLFLVVHAVSFHTPLNTFSTVEVNVFSGPNYMVTFHKSKVRAVTVLNERCGRSSEIMKHGSNIVLYHLLDILVNNYLPILNEFDDHIDTIEEELFDERDDELLENIFRWKKTVLRLRRIIGPQRDVLNTLSRGDVGVIEAKNRIYFRDVYDHLYRLCEMAETYRDLISGTMEVYLTLSANEQAETSHQMNRVVKTMTVVATILLPPTLISGIYGMNFDSMPELHSPYGYFFTIAAMVAVSAGMFFFLKIKKWI